MEIAAIADIMVYAMYKIHMIMMKNSVVNHYTI